MVKNGKGSENTLKIGQIRTTPSHTPQKTLSRSITDVQWCSSNITYEFAYANTYIS